MSAGRTAMAQMLASRMAALAAMMVGFAILGRLLEPEDFGHFAIAAAAFQALKTLANFGLRQYIIRSEGDLDPAVLASASGISLAIAALGCAGFWACFWFAGGGIISGAVAHALVPLGLALLMGPLILGTEVQLQRALAFRLPAYAGMVASVAEISTAILMALAGFGATALALGLLASEVASSVVLLAFGGVDRRAAFRLRLGDITQYARFGSRLIAINLIPNMITLLLVSMLGALAGPAATGLYNRSKVILDLLDRTIFEGIGPVILPMISGALRSGMPPHRVLATKLDYLTVLCWPVMAMIGLLAEPLVLVLLGDQWQAAVPAVRLLALGGLALPLTKMSVKFFTAIDALDVYLRIQIVFQAVTLVLGVAGAFISLEAFCAAISLGLISRACCIGLWLHRRYPGDDGAVALAFGRGAAVTAATLAAPVLIVASTGLDGIELLAVAAALAALCWAVSLALLHHPLMRDLAAMIVQPTRRAAGRLGLFR